MGLKPSMINYRNTHIIPFSFNYYEPASLREALEILSELGGSARILAGGTDLLVKMKTRQVEPKAVVNIKRIRELKGITVEDGRVRIKALTTLREIEESPIVAKYIPALRDAVKQMASIQVRSMATIGGNLCNASPAADTAPPLLVHNASVKIVGLNRERTVPLASFFKGPGSTVLEPGEILAEVIVEAEPGSSAFMKIGRVAVDLAVASAAVYVELNGDIVEEARIAAGAVAPTPIRCPVAEGALKGRRLSEVGLNVFKPIEGEVKPISDARASAEYRRHLVRILAHDAFWRAVEALKRDAE
ncbi:FAD binding domain-containing protein [Desulfurococcus mucosus]|uniref:Molybdopterin dehydrogenase FAD-binding protein n=1 Tax=Desulfurococcus mucosus (strain ATCC 35584 / DSM 2162 / JCM 9187 / O7/1) TaxID=765177 RepID=E8R8L3_DESM0|nr:xanthine dehydrogenase family protein subunit M [Desulfurococcus mucosus]ADV64839.1 molybdopterin dehydrogenase FAD-binding protein [Desulfurococcus mucosus DSM 2162]